MPPRKRLSVAESYARDIEREPSLLSDRARSRRADLNRPRVSESLFNNTTMLCCGESRCVCVCPDCTEPNVAGRGKRCDVCETTHAETVARERRESVKQALWLEMQLEAM